MHFKSVRLNKYLCAENGGGSALVASRDIPKRWETFRVCFPGNLTFQSVVFVTTSCSSLSEAVENQRDDLQFESFQQKICWTQSRSRC